MSPYILDASAWQESWDRQQEAYLPDREERFAALLEVVDAVTDGRPPRVLDLAGGTGSISLRVLRRFPDATTTLLDVDPVLLHIAGATLDDRATVVTANLRTPQWLAALPHREFDAVLTATALHWLPADRLTDLYGEIRSALRPGGVFVNADHMPDDGLPGLSARLGDRSDARRRARYAAGAVLSWEDWWEHVGGDPVLGPLLPERKKVFAERHATEFAPPVSWHLDTLRAAGYAEAGLVWRGARDAAVAGVA
ncbi:class I SAM-dependent methyltransferase [Phytohabitans rumicis]|uniref:Methyltransferase n=1 Tax=Phytohabitans rumicis TaxID=1076125 RepID=A0A6V8LL52_9ACTN|nr:class I SAM-dependent methyltransferase [Phytohabitans rumicis]GFJ94777.1 methyltransferase [Phytohabitans rumicis]